MNTLEPSPLKPSQPPQASVNPWAPGEAEKQVLANYRTTEEASRKPSRRNQEIVGIRVADDDDED